VNLAPEEERLVLLSEEAQASIGADRCERRRNLILQFLARWLTPDGREVRALPMDLPESVALSAS
jgi:hypothetical protein